MKTSIDTLKVILAITYKISSLIIWLSLFSLRHLFIRIENSSIQNATLKYLSHLCSCLPNHRSNNNAIFFSLHIPPFYIDLEKRLRSYAQDAYWAQVAGPSTWNMIQKSDAVKDTPGHDWETFQDHKAVRQGRDSQTQRGRNPNILQVKGPILSWCEE